MAEIDLRRAQECVSRALVTMEGFEVPLAGWRVHATAAEVSQRAEDTESSRRHCEISRVAILKLANSLTPEGPLRKAFLSAPSVTKILDKPVGDVIFDPPPYDRDLCVQAAQPAQRSVIDSHAGRCNGSRSPSSVVDRLAVSHATGRC